MILRTFGWAFLTTIVGLIVALLYGGPTGLAIAAILIVLEVSLSFDNAVVNARVLERMSPFWQKIFLSVGIIIAVFGMRLLFPLVVVGVTAGLSPARAWQLALEKGDPETPGTYGYLLNEAHPSIAAFGGMFLLMIFLSFVLDPEKDVHWLRPIEPVLSRVGRLDGAGLLIALLALAGFALGFPDHAEQVLLSGVIGLITFLVVHGLGELFSEGLEADLDELEHEDASARGAGGAQVAMATGRAAFFLFLYLEVLDASFSFDGVIGAFAITSDPIVIALGLGVGAFYVRSLTVYLVRQGTLDDYIYLEHGANWAIGALAVMLLITVEHEIPEVVTGLVGVGFITVAFLWSVRHNRRHADDEADEPDHVVATRG
ncbi:DUF475 domain-containing protein [Nocardioides sp. TRM66260-LWL]|uniref:DUF475 domain-containing protein n=1 Tax=Nocardioides sp. TRM66260-LWL TaxID=2874478 RepID=UPI001CC59AA2|nr:DUF475 domain-containing protein [Nocardioides sp. TRM66260-LWL]MBZ5736172.1 DUF475 domain-containing protein [Nocardioides sp. TRM66260-LWL]